MSCWTLWVGGWVGSLFISLIHSRVGGGRVGGWVTWEDVEGGVFVGNEGDGGRERREIVDVGGIRPDGIGQSLRLTRGRTVGGGL